MRGDEPDMIYYQNDENIVFPTCVGMNRVFFILHINNW